MSFAPNLTILIAAIAGWLAGAVWYGILGKPWLAALGRTKKDINKKRGTPAFYVPFVVAFIANLIIAWVLCGLMRHIGPLSLRSGLISGGFVWLGFVLTTLATNNAFGGRKFMLTVIDAGHWLAVLLVIGAVLGSLGG
jgi:hypothetical protein